MEKWKTINGYEGLYEVSTYGRIKSLGRWKLNHNKLQYIEERIKQPRIDPQGYLMVDLYKNNKSKTTRVHRAVAEAFIENQFNKSTVNHIDGDKRNNHVDNLEWATPREQNEHFYAHNLKSKQSIRNAITAMNKANSRPLIDVLSGKHYKSIVDAVNKLKISPKTIKRNNDRFIFI